MPGHDEEHKHGAGGHGGKGEACEAGGHGKPGHVSNIRKGRGVSFFKAGLFLDESEVLIQRFVPTPHRKHEERAFALYLGTRAALAIAKTNLSELMLSLTNMSALVVEPPHGQM